MRKEFIKNVLDVEVNGFACTVRYIVSAMYNVIDDDGFATIEQKIVEDVTFSSDISIHAPLTGSDSKYTHKIPL